MSRRQTITVTLPEGRTLNPGYRLRMDGIPIEVLAAEPVQRPRRRYVIHVDVDEDRTGGCADPDAVELRLRYSLSGPGSPFHDVSTRHLDVDVVSGPTPL